MKILLVGNYLADKQESMLLFAETLLRELSAKGHEVRLVRPDAYFGRTGLSSAFLKKWLGYIDKYIIFPFRLVNVAKSADIVHICDHSNALYVKYLRNVTHLVTCHDVLAIRGGLGEDTDCPASLTGKLLQRLILSGLRNSMAIACASAATKNDLLRLFRGKGPATIREIPLSLCQPFQVLKSEEAGKRLSAIPEINPKKPYLLHVGSGLKRKNRIGVLSIFTKIKDEWRGNLVFAGAPLDEEMISLVKKYNVAERVIEVAKPESGLLEALYNKAFVFIYPSRFEGYGLPIIEAQACGCPVLCSSDCGPFPEIVGDSAIMRPWADEDGFAEAVLRLEDPSQRNRLIRMGLENAKRFESKRMIDEYLALYTKLLEAR